MYVVVWCSEIDIPCQRLPTAFSDYLQGPRKCTFISENPFGDLGNTVYDEATEMARWSRDFHCNGMDNDEFVLEYLIWYMFLICNNSSIIFLQCPFINFQKENI